MLQRNAVSGETLGILKGIMAIPALSDFYLAGGTSLALQIGHRLSFDLGFFGKRPFEVQEILDELQDFAPISMLNQSKNILVLNVLGVKVDFVNYRYPVIFQPLVEEGIRLLSLPDIGAMKLTAIAGRGRKRDFFDLYFLLRRYSLKELLQFYRQKFEDGSEFMVARSLTYFDDADQDEEVVLLKEKLEWEEVKRTIEKEVKAHYR